MTAKQSVLKFSDWLEQRVRSGEVLVDLGDHYGYRPGIKDFSTFDDQPWTLDWYIRAMIDPMMRFDWFDDDEMANKLESHMNGEPLTEPVSIRQGGGFDSQCSQCGEHVGFVYDGTTIRATTQCSEPGGVAESHVEIDVPSGILVFDNDLRHLVPEKEPDHYVNHAYGIVQSTEWFADHGLICIFVGNTCPSVYRVSKDFFVVGSAYEYNEATGEEWEGPEDLSQGSVCTDLWWYSAMDYDLYLERGGEPFDNDTWAFKVNVTPGRYRFTSYKHSPQYLTEEDGIYSIIRRVSTK